MAIRIEWDEFEIALLIEACEEVLRKGKPKSEVVKTVSSNLRKRAISKNIAIDDVFRNENGIALQMQKMAYLLTHGEKGMPGASKSTTLRSGKTLSLILRAFVTMTAI